MGRPTTGDLGGGRAGRAGRQRRLLWARRGGASLVREPFGENVQPPDLRGSHCFVEIGAIRVDFSTTFGSYPGGDVYGGGTATTNWLINGETYTSLQDGVSAGWYSEDRVILLTISEIGAETWLGAYVVVSPDLLVPGTDIPLDGLQAEALLIYMSPDTNGQWASAAYLGNGSLSLDQASAEDGAVFSGVLDSAVLGSGGG